MGPAVGATAGVAEGAAAGARWHAKAIHSKQRARSSQPAAETTAAAWLGSTPSGGGSHVSGAELVQASLLAEVRLVMETAGLGERLLAFGIESVEDLANDELVSDTALRGGMGVWVGSCWRSFGVQGFAGCAQGG